MINLSDKPIALGRTAEFYTWKNGQVLKLFFDWFYLESIQFEQRMAQVVLPQVCLSRLQVKSYKLMDATDCFASACPGKTCGKFLKNNPGNSLLWRAWPPNSIRRYMPIRSGPASRPNVAGWSIKLTLRSF